MIVVLSHPGHEAPHVGKAQGIGFGIFGKIAVFTKALQGFSLSADLPFLKLS